MDRAGMMTAGVVGALGADPEAFSEEVAVNSASFVGHLLIHYPSNRNECVAFGGTRKS